MRTFIKILLVLIPFGGMINNVCAQNPTFNFQTGGMFLGKHTGTTATDTTANESIFLNLIRVGFQFRKESGSTGNTLIEGELVAIVPGRYSDGPINLYLEPFGDETNTEFVAGKSHFEKHDESHLIVRIHTVINKNDSVPHDSAYSGGFCIVVETLDPDIHNGIQFLQFIPNTSRIWDQQLTIETKGEMEAIIRLHNKMKSHSIQAQKIHGRDCPR